MKMCTRCNTTKSLSEFYKDKRKTDGLYPHCKACHADYVKQYRQTPKGKDISRESHLRYIKTPSGRKAKRKKDRKYRQTKQAKGLRNQWYHKTKDRHRQKYNARASVSYHVKKGHIPAAADLFCNECGNRAEHYHHHKGYAKKNYLDVIPLCAPCHREADS